jgi:NitT/TauT family transport system substrate-binding protein
MPSKFLCAFVKSLKSTAQDPAAVVDSVVKRNEVAKKDVELERLNMALYDNILTPQARAEGLGSVDAARFDKAIDQIALTYAFRARPRPGDIFDSSLLPPAADRVMD